MDRESMQKLRIDRRLIRRRGWIRGDDLERELAALPDVSQKIAPSSEAEEGEGGASEAPRADADPAGPEAEAPPTPR